MAELNNNKKQSILFVCLGNICRSPMAEIVCRALVKEKNIEDRWSIDSAGTAGYHSGEKPDSRTISTCKKYYPALDISDLRARQIQTSDFQNFDYIFVMDENNLSDVQQLNKRAKNKGKAKIALLGSYDPVEKNSIVEDPYYGGINGFEYNFTQIKRTLENFLEKETK
ncbi:hypothetical protein ABK040_012157 [Willaertia magna]